MVIKARDSDCCYVQSGQCQLLATKQRKPLQEFHLLDSQWFAKCCKCSYKEPKTNMKDYSLLPLPVVKFSFFFSFFQKTSDFP